MQEILFRGKRVDNGEWVESHSMINFGDSVFLALSVDVDCQHNDDFTKIYSMHSSDEFLVRIQKETLGQYTGLKDKNDTKVFEGDIVSNRVFNAIVEFFSGRFTPFNGEQCMFHAEECEVIGNIHDNPELLKGE